MFCAMDEEELKARVFAVECYYGAKRDVHAAAQRFDSEWNGQQEYKIRDVRHFVKRNADKLEHHYTLQNLPGAGRPHKLPDAAAKEAADIISQGYMQQHYVIVDGVAHAYDEHTMYTSLSDAVMRSRRLAAIVNHYDVTAEYLRVRLHEVDAALVHGRLPMKMQLSDKVVKDRQEHCENMLKLLHDNPKYLWDVTWADEFRFRLNMNSAGELQVWYNKQKLDGQPPESNPLYDPRHELRMDVLLLVNATRGCSWVEFLTGTTNIERDGRHNEAMRQQMALRHSMGFGPYKVSSVKYVAFQLQIMMHFCTMHFLLQPAQAGLLLLCSKGQALVLLRDHDKLAVWQLSGCQDHMATLLPVTCCLMVHSQQAHAMLPCSSAALKVKQQLLPWC